MIFIIGYQYYISLGSTVLEFTRAAQHAHLVLCTGRADSSQTLAGPARVLGAWGCLEPEPARVSWHWALGGSNRGQRADSSPLATRAGSDRGPLADSNSRLEPLGSSWWFLGGLSLGLGSAWAGSWITLCSPYRTSILWTRIDPSHMHMHYLAIIPTKEFTGHALQIATTPESSSLMLPGMICVRAVYTVIVWQTSGYKPVIGEGEIRCR